MADAKVFNTFDLVTKDDLSDDDILAIWNDSALKNIVLSELKKYMGGGRGLFSGLMSDAIPTQSNTGFNSWHSQGSASVIESFAGLTIKTPANGTAGYLLKSSLPATPYSITFLLVGCTLAAAAYPGFMVGWRNPSNGNTHNLRIQYNVDWNYFQLQVDGTGLTAISMRSPFADHFLWGRLKDDGTKVYLQASGDGYNFSSIHEIAKSSGPCGAAGYTTMFFGNTAGVTYDTFATMASYEEA